MVFYLVVVLSLSEWDVWLFSVCKVGWSCCWLPVKEEECSWRQLCLIWCEDEDTRPVCLDQWGNLKTPPEFDNALDPPPPVDPNFLRCSATTSSSFCILYLLVNLKRRCDKMHIITEAVIKRHPSTAAMIIKSLHSSVITTLEDEAPFLIELLLLLLTLLLKGTCCFPNWEFELRTLSSFSK